MDALGSPAAVAKSCLISQGMYRSASENYEGFCTSCREITNSGVEPDARKYECEACGEQTVYGIEEALMMGAIEIGPDGEED
jgi:predicted RNA-binding Zn-ribbon protein involved in translation (DUF1610 family)